MIASHFRPDIAATAHAIAVSERDEAVRAPSHGALPVVEHPAHLVRRAISMWVDEGSGDTAHALHRSWFFDAGDLRVTAAGGQVHLTGTVSSSHDRQSAAVTAWAAPGATNGINESLLPE